MKHIPKAFLILLIILIIGLSLRLYNLNEESLWIDEAFSLQHAQNSQIREVVEGITLTEGAPPGHYLLLHYWIKLFGNSEFSIRFLSLIFGLLSVGLIYILGAKFYGPKVGLLSALLLSSAMLQVLFSQEARLYSVYGFLALLITYFFVRIVVSEISHRRTKGLYIGYFLSMLFALYVNYLTIALMGIILIVATTYRKTFSFSKFVGINLLALIAALPLVGMLFKQFSLTHTGLAEGLFGLGLPMFLAQLGIFFYALPIFVVVAVLFFLLIFKKNTTIISAAKIPSYWFISGLFLFGLIYMYLSTHSLSILGIQVTRNPITSSFFLIRHSYFLVPIVYIFVSYKILKLKPKKWTTICIAFILFVNAFSLYHYYEDSTKAEWKEAVSFIHDNSNQDDSNLENPTILLDRGGYSSTFLLDYYFKGPHKTIRLNWVEGRREFVEIDKDDLLNQLQSLEEFWLVLSVQVEDNYPSLLDEHYQRESATDFKQIRVLHYSKK
jgi:mannosyltransferase